MIVLKMFGITALKGLKVWLALTLLIPRVLQDTEEIQDTKKKIIVEIGQRGNAAFVKYPLESSFTAYCSA